MGFFQELKEDLSQAVNELVPEEEIVEETVEEEVLEEVAEEVAELEEAVEEVVQEETVSAASTQTAYEPIPTPTYSFSREEKTESAPVNQGAISDEVATVTKRMKITGDLESDGSLDLIGEINGNLRIKGKLNITGVIVGNSEAAEVYAQEAKVTGDVTSLGSVKIGNNSVIRGNIYATSAVIAGAVKGDIDVKGPVILDSSAIVMGNIKSKAVQINNGAVIEGLCSQCYADVSPSAFFKD